MDSDLTFITNEEEANLLERFGVLIKNTKFFDVLVGYFYTSGFHALYKSLEKTEKVRILIGISTGRKTVELIEQAHLPEFQFSHAETKEASAMGSALDMGQFNCSKKGVGGSDF